MKLSLSRHGRHAWLLFAASIPLPTLAEDLMLQIQQRRDATGVTYDATKAERGHFAHTPTLQQTQAGDLIVRGVDSQGRELFSQAVRNPGVLMVESFDARTGKVRSVNRVEFPTSALEVRVPFPTDLDRIELLERPDFSSRSNALAASSNAPRQLTRQELEALLSNSRPTQAAPDDTGTSEISRAAPTAAAPVPKSAWLLNSGPSASRMDVILIGDGYAAGDSSKWISDAQTVAQGIMADPAFNTERQNINIRRVDVVSGQSGISEGGVSRNPALGSVLGCYGSDRLLCFDSNKVLAAVGAVAGADARDLVVVVANSTSYGGSGGPIASLTMHPQATELALHEIGHTAFGLADEYGADGTNSCNPIDEPREPNATIAHQRSKIKWSGQILSNVPLPTPPGALPIGTVGLFDGGRYCESGIYRPTEESRMRSLGYPWFAVNEKRIHEVFAHYRGPVTPTPNPATQSGQVKDQISRNGEWKIMPGGQTLRTTTAGQFDVQLNGPANTNFDLYLFRWDGTRWAVIGQSTSTTSRESVRVAISAGQYRIQVRALRGTGAFQVNYTLPQ